MNKALIITTMGKKVNNGHLYMINPLKKLGFQVEWAANFRDQNTNDFPISVHNISFSRNPFSIKNFIAYFQLRKLLEKNNYKLIHCNTPTASFVSRLAAHQIRKSKSLKVIYTAHGLHFYKGSGLKGFIIKLIEKVAASFTDAIIVMNNEDYISVKAFNKNLKLFKISGVGVDILNNNSEQTKVNSIREELGISHDRYLLVSIGEINRNKNHIMTLKAIKKLKEEKIHYIVCGEGKKMNKLKRYIYKNNLSNVHLLGFRNDVFDILKETDLFIQTSYREGLPRSIIEAMSFGIPCIGTNVRGIRDLIENEKNGFLVNIDNVDMLKQKIKILFDNRNHYSYIHSENIEKAKNFSSDNVKSQMLEVYDEILYGGLKNDIAFIK
jgi:glycosyltransferase involved in cell wall biosynthesis